MHFNRLQFDMMMSSVPVQGMKTCRSRESEKLLVEWMTVGDRLGGGRNNLTKGFKVFADFLARFILFLLWQLSTSGPRCGYISLRVRREPERG